MIKMETKTLDWQAGSALCRCCRRNYCYKDIATEYIWNGRREVYTEMILQTFNIKVSIFKSVGDDGISGLICDSCILRLRDATEFKRQLLECEQALNQRLNFGTTSEKHNGSLEISLSRCAKIEVEVIPITETIDVKRENETDSELHDDDNFASEYINYDYHRDSGANIKVKSKTETINGKEVKQEVETDSELHDEDNFEDINHDYNRDSGMSEVLLKSCENGDSETDIRNNALLSEEPVVLETERNQQYLSHILNRKEVGQFACDIGQRVFLNRDLKLRKIIHNNPRTNLKIQKSCRQSSHLRQHKLIHNEEKIERHLQRHTIIHSKVKRNQCDVCKKCFGKVSSLNRHKLIHTAEKRYQCDVCKKCFTQLGHLNRHSGIHNGQKPYQCDVCSKCFPNLDNLNTHTLIHTIENRHQCDVCKKGFGRLSSLKRHKFIHTGEKRYQCDVCKKCFNQLSHLNRHTVTHNAQKPFTTNV